MVVDLTSADVETFDTEYMKEHQMVLLEMFAPGVATARPSPPTTNRRPASSRRLFPT